MNSSGLSQEGGSFNNDLFKASCRQFSSQASNNTKKENKTRNRVSLFKRKKSCGNKTSDCSLLDSDSYENIQQSVLSYSNRNETLRNEVSSCEVPDLCLGIKNSDGKVKKVIECEDDSKISKSRNVEEPSGSLFSYLKKFAFKPQEEAEKPSSESAEVVDGKTVENCVDSSSSYRAYGTQSDIKRPITSPAANAATVDEYVTSFDIDFDDDDCEMFDSCIEKEKDLNHFQSEMNDLLNIDFDDDCESNCDDSVPPDLENSAPTGVAHEKSNDSLDESLDLEERKKLLCDVSIEKVVSNALKEMDDNFNAVVNLPASPSEHETIPVSVGKASAKNNILQNSKKTDQNLTALSAASSSNVVELFLSQDCNTPRTRPFQRHCSTPISLSTRGGRCDSDMSFSPNILDSRARCSSSKQGEGSSSKFRKRRFPGPAGILPDIPPGTNLSSLKQTELSNLSASSDCSYEKEIVCSQGTLEHFARPPWQHMLKDLTMQADPLLMKRFNIRLALWKASKKRLPKHIVFPVVCVLLVEITYNSNEADALFKDETGEISGKVSIDVIEKYKEYMVPFSAVVVKRAEFLCNQLIVKAGNIAAIYSSNGREVRLQDVAFGSAGMPDHPNVNGKDCSETTVDRPQMHPSHTVESADAALTEDYESFFADDMDDLLNNINEDPSMDF